MSNNKITKFLDPNSFSYDVSKNCIGNAFGSKYLIEPSEVEKILIRDKYNKVEGDPVKGNVGIFTLLDM